eukprot:15221_5
MRLLICRRCCIMGRFFFYVGTFCFRLLGGLLINRQTLLHYVVMIFLVIIVAFLFIFLLLGLQCFLFVGSIGFLPPLILLFEYF